jgi:hypothetical protein
LSRAVLEILDEPILAPRDPKFSLQEIPAGTFWFCAVGFGGGAQVRPFPSIAWAQRRPVERVNRVSLL